MKLECNISGLGRTLRIAAGIVILADGILFYHFGLPSSGIFSHALQLFFILAGAFGIFEGAVGWCAIRAMGVRTRI